MITIFLSIIILMLFFKSQDALILSKDRCDFLKAIFPFLIIIGHCGFFKQNIFFGDVRWSGPYIVAIFFFISGYGLQYKFKSKQLNFRYVIRKIRAMLLSIIFPLVIYILISCNNWDSLKNKCEDALSHGTLILPYSWFIIVIIGLYFSFYVIRQYFKKDAFFYVVYGFFLFLVAIMFYKIGWDSSSYVSNFAFLLGILFFENERSLLKYVNRGG